METTTVDDTIDGTSKYKAVELNNGKILLIPLRCMNDHDYLLLSDIQAMVPTATALLSNGKMIPFEIDTHSLLELVPKRVLVKETNVIWQVYSPDLPPHQQQQERTNQLEHKFDQLIQRLDQLVLSSSATASEQLHQQDSNSHGSVIDAETNTTTTPTTDLSIDQQQQSVPTSSIPITSSSNTSSHRSASPPPAFSSSPCPVPITTNTADPTSATSSTPSSPVSTSSHTSSPMSLSSSSSPPPLTAAAATTSDTTTRDNNMAGPSTSTYTNITTTTTTMDPPPPPSPSSPHQHQQHHDLAAAPPPSYETSIFGTIQALTQHIRRFEHHIPNRHKSPRWLARRAGWLGYEPTTIEQVAYQLVQLEMALLWTAVTESWIQERETWLTLVASARTERHLAGALVNLERHTLVLDEAWQEVREAWTRDLLEVIVSVGF